MTSPPSRHSTTLLIVLLAGLALRLLLPSLVDNDPYQGDGRSYLRLAENLEEHGTLSWDPPRPSTFRMPGVPLQIWFMHKFVDYDSWWMIFPNILLGWGCLLLLVLFLQRLRADRTVLLALALLYALVPILDFYSGQFYAEVPGAFLTLLSWYLFSLFLDERRAWQAAAAGLVLGLSLHFRPELVLNLLVLGLGLLLAKIPPGKRIVGAMVISGAALLALSPWVVRNHQVTGRFIPLMDESDFCLKGLHEWVNSWSGSQRQFKTVGWDFLGADLDQVPAAAFDDSSEKETLLGLQARGVYTCRDDAVLLDLARRRNARKPLRGYLLLPLQRAVDLAFLWQRSDFWQPDRIPGWLVRSLWLGYASLLNLVFLLALAGPLFMRKVPLVVRLISAGLLLRLLYLAYFRHPEHRYMVTVYPLAYVAAGYCCSRLYTAYRGKGSGAGAQALPPPR